MCIVPEQLSGNYLGKLHTWRALTHDEEGLLMKGRKWIHGQESGTVDGPLSPRAHLKPLHSSLHQHLRLNHERKSHQMRISLTIIDANDVVWHHPVPSKYHSWALLVVNDSMGQVYGEVLAKWPLSPVRPEIARSMTI